MKIIMKFNKIMIKNMIVIMKETIKNKKMNHMIMGIMMEIIKKIALGIAKKMKMMIND